MSAPRILLVDDQRDIVRMLRTSLELLNRDYVIVDVPSGEEALLEIAHSPFDLLITDVRLPGISGLELVKKLRARNAQAHIIFISGYPEMEHRARDLDGAFFSKPLNTEKFLKAVQTALGEEVETPAELTEQVTRRPRLADQLSTLRRDLGAMAVLLISDGGQVIARAGDVAALNLDGIVPPLMASFSAGIKVCQILHARLPTNIQFFDGGAHDVYTVNVGMYFGMAVIFEGERGAGQMGAVMRFSRRAADDLLEDLARIGLADLPLAELAEPVEQVVQMEEVEPVPLDPRLEEVAASLESIDTNAFWEMAVAEADPGTLNPEALTFEQAQKLGLVEL